MFEIKVYVNNEDELYNSFDKDRTTINSDVLDYLYNSFENRAIGEKLKLCFSSPNKIDAHQLKEALSQNIQSSVKELKKRKVANFLNSIRLLVIGCIFIALGISLDSKINAVVATVISTIGSFSVWEAANIWIKELPKIRIFERRIHFLKGSEVMIEEESGKFINL